MTNDQAEFPCPGECNHQFRKAEEEAALFGGQHDVEFVPGQPIWCPSCRDQIEADLADLHGLALGLAPGKLNTPRETSTGDSKRTKAATYPSLSPGWDAADAVIRWAVQLEDDTRRRLGHSEQPQTMRKLGDSVKYLQAWTTAILSDEDTGQLVGEQIQRHRRTLVRLTGTDRPVHRIKGECPVCGARGRISRADGSEVVKCGCGAQWPLSHVEHFAKVIADTERISA